MKTKFIGNKKVFFSLLLLSNTDDTKQICSGCEFSGYSTSQISLALDNCTCNRIPVEKALCAVVRLPEWV